jgi:hypothetical protein
LTGLIYFIIKSDLYVRKKENLGVALGVLLGGILTLTGLNLYYLPNVLELSRLRDEQNLVSLKMLKITPNNPLLIRMHPDTEHLRTIGFSLLDARVLKIPTLGTWMQERVNAPDRTARGEYVLRVSKDGVYVRGWALLPDLSRPADMVVICNKEPDRGRSEIITGLIASRENKGSDTGYNTLGFRHAFFEDFVPLKNHSDKYYELIAIDTVRRKAYALVPADSSAAE